MAESRTGDPRPHTILVCGSRDWDDEQAIRDRLAELRFPAFGEQVVIHGAARGADALAGRMAQDLGYAVREFPADWRGKGKAAGHIRNLEMLDQRPDLVLAFQRDGSRGTRHTIDKARKRGIPTRVIAMDTVVP